MAPRWDYQLTESTTPGPPCIVCPCAQYMDAGAVWLPRRARLPRPKKLAILLGLKNAANKCRRRTFDQGARMTGLQQQDHEIQYQRLAVAVAGEGPHHIRRSRLALLLIPRDRESDQNLCRATARFPARRPETDGGGREQVAFLLRHLDREVTEGPAASSRGIERAAHTTRRPSDARAEDQVHNTISLTIVRCAVKAIVVLT